MTKVQTKIDALFAMAISRSPRYAELAGPSRRILGGHVNRLTGYNELLINLLVKNFVIETCTERISHGCF